MRRSRTFAAAVPLPPVVRACIERIRVKYLLLPCCCSVFRSGTERRTRYFTAARCTQSLKGHPPAVLDVIRDPFNMRVLLWASLLAVLLVVSAEGKRKRKFEGDFEFAEEVRHHSSSRNSLCGGVHGRLCAQGFWNHWFLCHFCVCPISNQPQFN